MTNLNVAAVLEDLVGPPARQADLPSQVDGRRHEP